MNKVALGRSDLRVTRLGMGGCPLGGHGWGHVDDADSIRAVQRAMDLGVNFFDTADVYGLGHSEELLARALGNKRKDMVIASKFGVRWDASGNTTKDISPGYARLALENSLRRLGLDCIPLYYIHWPDDVTPIAETMRALVQFQEQGKIRWIGVSNFSTSQLAEALSVADVQALQVQFSLVDRGPEKELLPFSQSAGVPIITWGSLAHGLLTGKYGADAKFGPDDRRSRYENFKGEKFQRSLAVVEHLRKTARRIGVQPAQLALRWVLETPGVGCALFGAKTPEQVESNLGALGWSLPPEDYQELAGGGTSAGGR